MIGTLSARFVCRACSNPILRLGHYAAPQPQNRSYLLLYRSITASALIRTTQTTTGGDSGDSGPSNSNGAESGTGTAATKEKDKEDTALSEIITIYERMTKGRAQDTKGVVYQPSKHDHTTNKPYYGPHQEEEELVSLVPTFDEIAQITKSQQELEQETASGPAAAGYQSQTIPDHLDFNKYRNIELKRYTFFSASTDVIQSNTLHGLTADYAGLLKSKLYWLNILNPTEEDFRTLHSSFNVHDLTLSDIRQPNSEEKIEVFKHYMFLSFKLIFDSTEGQQQSKLFDNDFNMLLFKDFVITIHRAEWPGIKDILGFLNLLCSRSSSPLAPYWVFYSALTELKQDARFQFDKMEPEINEIRIASKTMAELSDVMRRIFDMEFHIYILTRFIKPKMNILKLLETKYDKRLNKVTAKLVRDIHEDLKDVSHEMAVFSHILERSQDTVLGLVNVERSKEANDGTKVMNRLSQLAIVFLPIQAVAGFFGMNVQVPFQHEAGTFYFWSILCTTTVVALTVFALRNVILLRSFSIPKKPWMYLNRKKGPPE